MSTFLERLLQEGPVLTDGAWGTELQARGLAIGECPDGWNLTHPDRVESVARAYVEAGSRVILTNTFGANRLRLSDQAPALAGQVAEINRAGAQISLRAAADRAFVFASIGPSGRLMLDSDLDPAALESAFREQAVALAEAGVHGLVVETMSDLIEARLAVRAARTTGLPVVASMVYDSGKDKDRTMMGTTPEEAAVALAEAGADVIGANCGQGIAGFVPICRRLHAASSRSIWIKANAGLPELVDGRAVYRTTPEFFASFAPALRRSGAGWIGGCCGTNPDFIRALHRALADDRAPA